MRLNQSVFYLCVCVGMLTGCQNVIVTKFSCWTAFGTRKLRLSVGAILIPIRVERCSVVVRGVNSTARPSSWS